MTNPPAISDAEWEVMTVLWDSPSAMIAAEVIDRLAGKKVWAGRTIKTLLNRLVKKGALSFEIQGNRYLYRAAVAREQCVRAAGRSFLSRVFNGSAGPMLVHFVNHTTLTDAELAELQQLLSEKQSRSRRTRKR